MPTTTQARCAIRWMIQRDLPEVLSIEEEVFDYPWCEAEFRQALRQRNCIGMVAQRDGRIQAFMIYHLHRHHLELENLAVHPVYQRESVGRQMVAKLIQKLSPQRRTRIVADVRESNLPAQLFFRTMGFRATSVLRNHYEQNDESAYRFEFRI